jgi:hypothetical protein
VHFSSGSDQNAGKKDQGVAAIRELTGVRTNASYHDELIHEDDCQGSQGRGFDNPGIQVY